jgi:hypothetical protein
MTITSDLNTAAMPSHAGGSVSLDRPGRTSSPQPPPPGAVPHIEHDIRSARERIGAMKNFQEAPCKSSTS